MIRLNLVLLINVVVFSGCTFLNVLDTNALSGYQESKKHSIQAELERKATREVLIGKTKSDVKKVMGKGKTLSDNYPYLTDLNCADRTCDCGLGECIKKHSNDVWYYWYKSKSSAGSFSYNLYVFFENDIVVYVK